jgi:hypothetical protein
MMEALIYVIDIRGTGGREKDIEEERRAGECAYLDSSEREEGGVHSDGMLHSSHALQKT